MTPKVAIIILNWNGKKWLKPCLDSVLKSEYENFHVYLVDNNSSDGSQKIITDKYPTVTLIQNHKNLGFAEGNNVGMRRALKDGADYIILLNQDTKVDPGWISPLVEAAEEDPSIGILSPMQLDYEGEGLDPFFYRGSLKKADSYEDDQHRGEVAPIYETTWAIGAAFMMSRDLCERVGLFDPLYFLYAEEYDLCRRARYHGFRVAIATRSKIFHHNTLVQNEVRPFIFVRNQALFFWKNPDSTTWAKIKIYLRWGGAKNVATSSRWPKDFRHRLLLIKIHLWTIIYLPFILWCTHKERLGACYLK